MELRVRNWHLFQHYQGRRPPWIKCYRTLLDDEAFQSLDGEDAKLLVNIWLLASEDDGRVPSASKSLAWRLRYASTARLESAVRRLLEAGFLEADSDASKALASCKQDASPETEKETERETETEGRTAPAARARPTWLTPFGEAWTSAYGGEPPYAKLGKYLRPLILKHQTDAVLAAWLSYLGQTGAEYASPARFSETFGRWNGSHAAPTHDRRNDATLLDFAQEEPRGV